MDKKIEQLLDALEVLIDIKLIMAFNDHPVTTNTMLSNDLDMWKPAYYEKRERLRISLMKVLEGVLEKAAK